MAATATAYAKINLVLHVRRRRADGYHELETLFAFVDDGDRLTLADAAGDALTIAGPFAAGLGAGADNLVLRAAAAFRARYGGAGAAFALDKRLPVAAGIGGGSADAAAALRLLAGRAGVAGDDAGLTEIAAGLGADVPACLASTGQRGTGRGDELAPVTGTAGVPVLLVNPRRPLSTGAVFGSWDGMDRGPLGEGDPIAVALQGRNDLEPPARALEPGIDAVLGWLGRRAGARLARMSGSGATCFALFADIPTRNAAAAEVPADWWAMAGVLR
ncbi:MAG: 4-(cytidine 5'-diphospho)-2-C-methyl-D-erythritol kinase [Sphingomonas fennica]